MFITRIKGFIIAIVGAYLGYILYQGEFLEWINTTFLKNIYTIVVYGLWFISFALLSNGLIAFLTGKVMKTDTPEERAEKERLKQIENAEAMKRFQGAMAGYSTEVNSVVADSSNNTPIQQAEKPKQKVKNGIIVKYRIKTIGTDQSEIVQTNSEAEARRIIKAKYPTMDVHIISAMYNYE